MSGLTGIVVETPALATPSGALGPITALASYRIERRLNSAGVFSVAFPASEALAESIVTNWRISITQEGNDPATYPGWLLRRGAVKRHHYAIDASGAGLLTVDGVTPLALLAETINHVGLAFADANLASFLASIAPTVSFNVPSRTAAQLASVIFSDQTQLAEILKAAELFRCNLREKFEDETTFDFTDTDDVPDSGYRFVQLEAAPSETTGDVLAARGIGLIAGTPTIDYDGSQLANLIKPVGADWDGKELTLQYATSTAPYSVHTGTNPDATSYYYLSDTTSITNHGTIETQLVRSDIKNPNNPTLDAGVSRQEAADCLYAVTAGIMLQRRSELITLGLQIANGDNIWALPGDRVRVRYVGNMLTSDGVTTWKNLDQDFMVESRVDTGDPSGVRMVTFSLISYAQTLSIPSLPTAIPIPPPYRPSQPPPPPKPPRPDPFKRDPNKRDPTKRDPNKRDPDGGGGGGGAPGQNGPPSNAYNNGAYQPCCADPTTDVNKGAVPPPTDIGDDTPAIGNMYAFRWNNGEFPEGGPLLPGDWFLSDIDDISTPGNVTVTGVDMDITQLGTGDYTSHVYIFGGGTWHIDTTTNFKYAAYLVHITGAAPVFTLPSGSHEWSGTVVRGAGSLLQSDFDDTFASFNTGTGLTSYSGTLTITAADGEQTITFSNPYAGIDLNIPSPLDTPSFQHAETALSNPTFTHTSAIGDHTDGPVFLAGAVFQAALG